MGALFDHEKLEVYQLELQFIAWVTPFMGEVKRTSSISVAEACDHLNRGSLSSLLNTAEGNGKRQRQVRSKFFDDARGSAAECAACLDALVVQGATSAERVVEGKEMLARVYSMLSKLVQRFSSADRVNEDEPVYGVGGREEQIENENEDEDEDEKTSE